MFTPLPRYSGRVRTRTTFPRVHREIIRGVSVARPPRRRQTIEGISAVIEASLHANPKRTPRVSCLSHRLCQLSITIHPSQDDGIAWRPCRCRCREAARDGRPHLDVTTLRCTSGSWAAKDSPVSCQTTVDHKTAQGTTYVLSVRQRARRSRQDTALRFKEAGLALEAMASVISDFESGANLLHVSEWMWFT